MLNPSIGKLLNEYSNRYSLVIACAKRAREICNEAEKKGEPVVEKPVNIAMNELAAGKFSIEENE